MTQKIKSIGLLAILPLAMVALAPELIGDAYAVNPSNTGIIGGFIGVIDETKMTPVEGGPFVKLTQVNKASANSENLYKVTYEVFAGEKNIVDLFLLVESDNGKVSTNIGGISAEASSTTVSLINALDPETISVEMLRCEINS